jgi:hypothetical protein
MSLAYHNDAATTLFPTHPASHHLHRRKGMDPNLGEDVLETAMTEEKAT